MTHRIAILFCMLLLSVPALSQTKEADAILGTWLIGSGEGKVQIYKSGSSYFGKLVWLKNPNDEKGQPKVDKNNSDPKHQKQPLLGLIMLRNFVYDEDQVWNDGEIYDPKNGKTYSCKMTLKDWNTLDVRGYIGISLFGRTDTWKRQP